MIPLDPEYHRNLPSVAFRVNSDANPEYTDFWNFELASNPALSNGISYNMYSAYSCLPCLRLILLEFIIKKQYAIMSKICCANLGQFS